LSGRTSPPVWHDGQYCAVVLANVKSRIVPPHTGHGSPARPCTRMAATFAAFWSAIGMPRRASIAERMTPTVDSYSRSSSSGESVDACTTGEMRAACRISSE
jgi:hypothetical protein